MTSRNSRTPALAISPRRRFSTTTIPWCTLRVWGTTNGSSGSSGGDGPKLQVSHPVSAPRCSGGPPARSMPGPRSPAAAPLLSGAPRPAPAGGEEHRVTGPHVKPGLGQRLLGVGHRDDITGAEPFGTPCGRHVQQQPPGHYLGKGVDTEPVGAVVLDDVGQPEPVVAAVADPQMVEPVHVGAHLLGRGDPLDDPVDFVAAKASRTCVGAVLAAQVVAGGQALLEGAAGKGRDVLVQHVRQLV